MKSKGNIVFLGMMGSGKTTIGKLISKKLNLKFYDIDQQIEKKQKMNISDIFSIKGENFFRKLEEEITLNILKKKNIIISLGGGAFLNKKIRDETLEKHISFWLNWSSQIIVKRIKDSKKRPIASKLSINELKDLIEKRSNIYSKAMYKLNCDNLTKNEITDNVIKFYEAN